MNGVIVRYDVHRYPGVHDLYFVPDELLEAMRSGKVAALPGKAMGEVVALDGQVIGTALRWPKEAVRGSRDDVVAIIEKGWLMATRKLPKVPLTQLPIVDHAVPVGDPGAIDVGGPVVSVTVPNRANGKTAMAERVAALRLKWERLDEIRLIKNAPTDGKELGPP